MGDVNRIERMYNKQARVIRGAFTTFLVETTLPDRLKIVEEIAHSGRIERILEVIDNEIERFANTLVMVSINSGNEEARVIVSNLKAMAKAGEIDWSDKQIAQMLNRTKVNTVQNLTRDQREAVRENLIEGIRAGETPAKLARRFKTEIGLTKKQRQYVRAYQQALEMSNRSALSPELRPRRFDRQIERAIEENDVLSADQIERMVGAYSRNLINHRADTIAKTESLKLVSQARHIAARRAIEQSGLDRSKATKTWLRTSAAHPRETHLSMVGDTVGIDEAFTSPTGARLLHPGDTSLGAGPQDVVNCQCGVSYSLGE